jgi:glycosyltransferase involved in cell wall biosynthesis
VLESVFFATIPDMTKTKVLFVDHTPFAGGAQLRMAADIKWLDRDKFEPFLLIDKNSKFESIYKNSKVKIYKIPFSKLNLLHPIAIPRLLSSIKEFGKLIQQLEPDVVVANTTRALLISAMSSKIHRSDFKLVSYVRDYDYPKWVFSLIGDEVDKYLFVSDSVKKFYKLSGDVIYLGSDFKNNKNYQRNKKIFTIGYLGRLVDWKGALDLQEAFKKIANKHTELIFWGTGKAQSGSIENILKKSVSKQIKLAGFTTKPEIAYAKMDCYVHPSKNMEPFATTVVEAALSKVPIIATNNGGTSEFIVHEKNGLLVKPGDTNQLAQALLGLIDDPDFALRLATNAYKDAQRFTQEKFIKVFEKKLIS